MAAWLPQPVEFQSSREFDCKGYTPSQCEYYKERWHNWYVADWTFALPTVVFFMCTIGIFTLGHVLTQLLALTSRPGLPPWRRLVAATRYLSYRGFRVEAFGWNSAPVGILFLGAIGTIFFFCMDLAPSPYYWPGPDMIWGNSPPLGTRSGWLALACMPFVFATATKSNWITLVTGVTHEKLQVFHRWISYAFFILALMHTFPFIVWHIRNHDMVNQVTVSNTFEYWTGIVALLFQAWLTIASFGPLRSLAYEFFKFAHFFSAAVFVIIFFWHCGGTLTSWDYFVATAAVYVPCWVYPWLRTIFEYGTGQKARIFVEEGGFTRITIPTNFKWQPGQHCFLRFRGFGIHALSSHPFTICSLPSASAQDRNELVFYIRRRRGFTAKLYNYALARPGVQVPVLVDGPFGGINNQKFFDSDRLLVIAGGSGAGWVLPFAEQFLRYRSTRATQEPFTMEDREDRELADAEPIRAFRGPRALRIVLSTRDKATCTWFHKALDALLSRHRLLDPSLDLTVEVHLTGEAERITTTTGEEPFSGSGWLNSDTDLSGSSAPKGEDKLEQSDIQTVQTSDCIPARGRPNLPLLIREEAAVAASGGQSTGCFVCGPLGMQNDVRNAVAQENLSILRDSRSSGIYLHLEHFSWA